MSGMTFLKGGVGSVQFFIKNKLKSEIFYDKNVFLCQNLEFKLGNIN